MTLVPKNYIVRLALLGAPAAALLLLVAVIGPSPAHAAATTTASSSAPVISNIAATSTDASALVSWMTDVPATSQVAYGTSSAYSASTTLDSTLLTTHAATLANLMPSTTYHFSVVSNDAAGSSTASLDQTFMTAASSSPATSTPPGSTSTSTASTTAYLSLSAYNAMPGAQVTALGSGFAPSETVHLGFASTTNASSTGGMASSTATTTLGSTMADLNGAFSLPFTVPSVPQGLIGIWATGATSGLTATNTLYIEPASTSTGTSTPPATSTPSIALNVSSGMPGSTVTASGTGFTPSENIALAFGTTTASTGADTNGNFSTPLTIPQGSGTVNLSATGLTSGRMATTTFYIEPASTSTGTSTASSTTITDLQNEITQLQNEVSDLQNAVDQLQTQVQSLLGTGAGNPPPPPATTTSARIDQNGQTFNAGGSIDFGGHGFGREEHVAVMLNGSQVGSAFTNSTGGFSTGSMSLPATSGTYTYTFVGQNSGITGQATITVT